MPATVESRPTRSLGQLAAFALMLVLGPSAWAATGKANSEAQQRYNQERAHCMIGASSQDRATCLREARAALQEARRNRLQTGAGVNLEANATVRCNAQPAADRDACVQRIRGSGTTRGSVSGGGVIREVETPVK